MYCIVLNIQCLHSTFSTLVLVNVGTSVHAASLWALLTVLLLPVRQLSAVPLQPAVSPHPTLSCKSQFTLTSISPPLPFMFHPVSQAVSLSSTSFWFPRPAFWIWNSVGVFRTYTAVRKPTQGRAERGRGESIQGYAEGVEGVSRAGIDAPAFQKLSMRWRRLSTKWDKSRQERRKMACSKQHRKGWQRERESRIDSSIIALRPDSNTTKNAPLRLVSLAAPLANRSLECKVPLGYTIPKIWEEDRERRAVVQRFLLWGFITPAFLLLDWIHHRE